MKRPIGIFDSGVGGLSVVKEILEHCEGEDIIYFGDTARVPYGTKSRDTIVRFSIENTKILLNFNIKLLVVACNTASSFSLPTLRRRFNIPIVGVLRPGAVEAVRVSSNKRIGVIGTSATISSRSYEKEINRIAPGYTVFTQDCPLFVSLVEEGWLDDEITFQVANRYLAPLNKKRIDTLILGCTHYPLLKNIIGKVMGEKVHLVDSAHQTAGMVREMLKGDDCREACKAKGKEAVCKFYVSDEPGKFVISGEKFLGRKISFVRKI